MTEMTLSRLCQMVHEVKWLITLHHLLLKPWIREGCRLPVHTHTVTPIWILLKAALKENTEIPLTSCIFSIFKNFSECIHNLTFRSGQGGSSGCDKNCTTDFCSLPITTGCSQSYQESPQHRQGQHIHNTSSWHSCHWKDATGVGNQGQQDSQIVSLKASHSFLNNNTVLHIPVTPMDFCSLGMQSQEICQWGDEKENN